MRDAGVTPRVALTPGHRLADPSAFLFIVQVRGFETAYARLAPLREHREKIRRGGYSRRHPTASAHLVFEPVPRDLERGTSFAGFQGRALGRFLSCHVCRIADGALVELPMAWHNAKGSQWPSSHWSTSESEELSTGLLQTLCFVHTTLLRRGGSGRLDHDELRINFKSSSLSPYEDYYEAWFGPCDVNKGGGVLTFLDELSGVSQVTSLQRG